MATILNIETSGNVCSVALTSDGMILTHQEDFTGRNHAALLSDFIKACLDYGKDRGLTPDAVAVSLGPGSYTGLRIGLSEAKGLAYALKTPLIGIHTLRLLVATALFETDIDDPQAVYIPMIDARRMEVYTGAYDIALNELIPPQALVLDNSSYSGLKASGRTLAFFGSGAIKARDLFADCQQAKFIDNIEPLAQNMTALAELAYIRKEFIDTAYSTPIYLKEFQATTPKHKIL